jgi:hypothetical protein
MLSHPSGHLPEGVAVLLRFDPGLPPNESSEVLLKTGCVIEEERASEVFPHEVHDVKTAVKEISGARSVRRLEPLFLH